MRAGKLSATALFIAKSQFLLGRRKQFCSLCDPEAVRWYEQFLNAAGHRTGPEWVRRWQYFLIRTVEKFSIPGIYLHQLLRKLLIKSELTRLLADSKISQVVVVAAGFDPLCSMLASRFPDVKFWELDLPATQEAKRLTLERSYRLNNLILLPSSPGMSGISETLHRSSFKSNLATAFIVEGLTMYLSEEEVSHLLISLHSLCPKDAYLFLTFMERRSDRSIQFENATCFVEPWLRMKGEPFKWGIAREQLSVFVGERGWQLDSVTDHHLFRERYLLGTPAADETLAVGECLAMAHSKRS